MRVFSIRSRRHPSCLSMSFLVRVDSLAGPVLDELVGVSPWQANQIKLKIQQTKGIPIGQQRLICQSCSDEFVDDLLVGSCECGSDAGYTGLTLLRRSAEEAEWLQKVREGLKIHKALVEMPQHLAKNPNFMIELVVLDVSGFDASDKIRGPMVRCLRMLKSFPSELFSDKKFVLQLPKAFGYYPAYPYLLACVPEVLMADPEFVETLVTNIFSQRQQAGSSLLSSHERRYWFLLACDKPGVLPAIPAEGLQDAIVGHALLSSVFSFSSAAKQP